MLGKETFPNKILLACNRVMPLKCCVPQCKSNYKSMNTKVPVSQFPKDLNEQKKWIDNIPHTGLKVTKYSAVC